MDYPKNRAGWRKAWEENNAALKAFKPPAGVDIEEGEAFERGFERLNTLLCRRKELMRLWPYMDIVPNVKKR